MLSLLYATCSKLLVFFCSFMSSLMAWSGLWNVFALFIWQEPVPGQRLCSLIWRLCLSQWNDNSISGKRGGRSLWWFTLFEREACTYCSYVVFAVNWKFSKLNVWLNTTCVAEACRDGGWVLHPLQEQFSGKLQRASFCIMFMKRILHNRHFSLYETGDIT